MEPKITTRLVFTCLCFEIGLSSYKNEVSPLHSKQSSEVFGSLVTLITKNNSEAEGKSDVWGGIEQYLDNHILRIKSPFSDSKVYDYKLKNLIIEDESVESGRKEKLKKALLPFLLSLHLKSSIVVPVLMVFLTLIAIKGFWAGMTALFVSKALVLKAFLDSDNKKDRDQHYHDDDDDYEYHHHHSHHFDQSSHRTPYDIRHNEFQEHLGNVGPIDAYVKEKIKSIKRFGEDKPVKTFTSEKWDFWENENLNSNKFMWGSDLAGY